jgi:8-oxo-dGTP pyrophosphatase MutT (NUDIX family)
VARRVAPARPARTQGVGVETVRAAGGLVFDGDRVLVVHRPRYDDWTFPKGKAEPGETDEECALREVREETGLDTELVDELPSTSYTDSKGRPKQVRYWRMRPAGGVFEPGDEVDEIRWCTPGEAAELLSYDRDRTVLAAA